MYGDAETCLRFRCIQTPATAAMPCTCLHRCCRWNRTSIECWPTKATPSLFLPSSKTHRRAITFGTTIAGETIEHSDPAQCSELLQKNEF